MAAQLRPLKGREVLRKLRKAGFEIVRIKGSAYYLRNPQTGRLTSVHVHGNRDIPLGTLRAIVIEQAGLSPESSTTSSSAHSRLYKLVVGRGNSKPETRNCDRAATAESHSGKRLILRGLKVVSTDCREICNLVDSSLAAIKPTSY